MATTNFYEANAALFGKDRLDLLSRCVNGETVRMGEALGQVHSGPAQA